MTGRKPLTITLRPEITVALSRLAAMKPWERAVAADRLRAELMAARVACSEVRRYAAVEMRESGMTWQEVGDLLGMTRGKAISLANQIATEPW